MSEVLVNESVQSRSFWSNRTIYNLVIKSIKQMHFTLPKHICEVAFSGEICMTFIVLHDNYEISISNVDSSSKTVISVETEGFLKHTFLQFALSLLASRLRSKCSICSRRFESRRWSYSDQALSSGFLDTDWDRSSWLGSLVTDLLDTALPSSMVHLHSLINVKMITSISFLHDDVHTVELFSWITRTI